MKSRDTWLWLQNCWLLWTAAGALIGALFGALGPTLEARSSAVIIIAMIFAGWGLAWFCGWGKAVFYALLLSLLAAFWCFGRAHAQRARLALDNLAPWSGQTVTVIGRLHSTPRSSFGSRRGIMYVEQVIDPTAPSGVRAFGHRAFAPLWLKWRSDQEPLPGQAFAVSGKLRALEAQGSFAKYCDQQGIHLTLSASSLMENLETRLSGRERWRCTLARWRLFLTQRAERSLSEREGQIFVAMALGESYRLDGATLQMFRAAGLSHMLAASGLHLGLIMTSIMMINKLLGFSARHSAFPAAFMAFLYAALVDFRPSIVRALLMTWTALLALVAGRPRSLGRAWSGALTAVLLIEPLQVEQIGFQLSYGAVLGIWLWWQPLRHLGQRMLYSLGWGGRFALDYIWQSLSVTLAVTLILAPLLVWHFGELAWIAGLANLVVTPLLELSLLCGLGAWCLDIFGLASPLWWLCGRLANGALWSADVVQHWGQPWQIPAFGLHLAAAYYLILFGVWLILYVKQEGKFAVVHL